MFALLRSLFWLVKISLITGVVILAALWLYRQEGFVTITASGYEVGLPLGVAVLAVIALLVFISFLWWAVKSVWFAPKAMQNFIDERRKSRGYRALSTGFMAVTAEDKKKALKASKQATLLLSDNRSQEAMVLLLRAQSMQLAGKVTQARQLYENMTDKKETRFLGLRGLAHLALKDGDDETAIKYVQQAREIMPQSKWAVETLYNLTQKQGDLITAQEIMQDDVITESLSKEEQKAEESKLWLMRARDAHSQGLGSQTLSHIKKAWKGHKSLEIAQFYSGVLLEQNKKRQATNIIEEAWQKTPDLSLADLYMTASNAITPLEQVKSAETLSQHNSDTPQSRLILARTALNAELWGETERYLDNITFPENLQSHVDKMRQELNQQKANDNREATIQ